MVETTTKTLEEARANGLKSNYQSSKNREVGATTSCLNNKVNSMKKQCNECIVCALRIKRMDIFMELDVGGLIKKCRKKAKLSQEAFADLMHTTQSTISRIEQNIIGCEAGFLAKAAAITNSQELVVTTLFSVDVAMQILQTVPMFIGGFFSWIL